MRTEISPSIRKHLLISILESIVAGFVAALTLGGLILIIT